MPKRWLTVGLVFVLLVISLLGGAEILFSRAQPAVIEGPDSGQRWLHAAQVRLLEGRWQFAAAPRGEWRATELHAQLDAERVRTIAGIEVDVIWEPDLRRLIVSHDHPEDPALTQVLSGRRLTLATYVAWLDQQLEYPGRLWLDLKNLGWWNAGEVGDELDRIFVTAERRGRVYVESRNPLPLPLIRERGYRVLYWIKPGFSRRGMVEAARQVCLTGSGCLDRVWMLTKRSIGYVLQKGALGYARLSHVSLPHDQYHRVEDEYRKHTVFVWTNSLQRLPFDEQRRIVGELDAKERIGVILVDDLRLLD